jgi:hypothetical protein
MKRPFVVAAIGDRGAGVTDPGYSASCLVGVVTILLLARGVTQLFRKAH